MKRIAGLLSVLLLLGLLACAAAEEAQTQRILAQCDAGQDERFLLLRRGTEDVLRLERKVDGVWSGVWTNNRIIQDACFEWAWIEYAPEVPGSETVMRRYTRHHSDQITLCAGYDGFDYEHFYMTLERDAAGEWQVYLYGNANTGRWAYLFDDVVLLNYGRFSSTMEGELWFGQMNRAARSFNPLDIAKAQEEINEVTHGMPDEEYAEPLYIALKRKQALPVHTLPDDESPREADGKAAVSLDDWIAVYGRSGHWLDIRYETNKGAYRTGYVDASRDAQLMRVLDFMGGYYGGDVGI